jgi:pimeloyl-ACP methyl ester carboxylesterase
VLTWDRPESGQSGLIFDDSPSEWHLWTDLLHDLCLDLGLLPAYFGGGSSGSELSVLMAHRYPDDVKGLILDSPSNSKDTETLTAMAEAHYLCLADAAEQGGMQGAIDRSSNPERLSRPRNATWLAEYVAAANENRQEVLSLDPVYFAKVLRTWAKWMMSPRFNLSNLTDKELANIKTPAIIAHGFDPMHTEAVARELYDALPNAEWVDFSSLYTPEEIKAISDLYNSNDTGWTTRYTFRYPFFEHFLRRVESGDFVSIA